MTEACTEAILDREEEGSLELLKLVDEMDFLQFQVCEIPDNNKLQRIAISSAELQTFYIELLDTLKADHPQFLWRRALSLSETGESCSIKLDGTQLSQAV